MNDLQPLARIRVFELSIAIAGPTCGRYLAHFGADIIKVESPTNPDIVRRLGPFWLDPNAHGHMAMRCGWRAWPCSTSFNQASAASDWT